MDLTISELLALAKLELETYYRAPGNENCKQDGLHINEIPLVDVIGEALKNNTQSL